MKSFIYFLSLKQNSELKIANIRSCKYHYFRDLGTIRTSLNKLTLNFLERHYDHIKNYLR